jgi:Domain of unknown function (DUF3576)
MSARHYRLLLGVAASLSLLSAGCSSNRPEIAADPVTGKMPTAPVARSKSDEPDTQATLWTVLGFAKRPSEQNFGPQTGNTVSPILWQATLDTLHFAGTSAEDPVTGLLVTKWYSPPGNPAERMRVSVFVLSRALRSDSVAVTIERQGRTPAGQWQDTPIARDAVSGIENAILLRARQIHAERYRNTMYK